MPKNTTRPIHRCRITRALSEALEPRTLFSAPPLPTIPNRSFDITTFGAVGDNATDNTNAIQAALNAAKTAGGGTVNIPAGTFLSGPLSLFSSINLHLATGATLRAEPYGSTYFPVGQPTGSGTTKVPDPRTYANFLDAETQHDVEISGTGTIDGQGAPWWAAFDNKDIANRPILIYLMKCTTVDVEGVTLTSSPAAHLVFKNGVTNATVQNLTIATPVPSNNTDGIDVSGTHILINNCNISDGDDNIAVGGSVAPTSDLTITNCTMGAGHGLSIGSITKAGINGMTVNNITFNGTDSGIRIKTARDRGGIVQNLSYSNITMTNVGTPIFLTMYYPSLPTSPQSDPAQSITATTPFFKNIAITNLTSTNPSTSSSVSAGIIWGLPESPITNLTLTNVNISTGSATPFKVYNTQNMVWAGNSSVAIKTGSTVYSTYNQTVVNSGWTDSDIGSPTTQGTSLYDPAAATWTNVSTSSDISTTAGGSDQFNLASTPFTGDGSLIARVVSHTNTNALAKAGIMMRDSTSATSAYAAVVATPTSGLLFLWRNADGTTGSIATATTLKAPVWFKLVRIGSTFSAYYSTSTTTPTSWTQIGTSQTLTLAATVQAGLAVTSKNTASASTAVFSNVSVLPPAPIISSIVVNDGSAQRSMVTHLTVNFSSPVSLASNAIALTQRVAGSSPVAVPFTLTPAANASTFATSYVLTFSGTGGSLADGIYDLSVSASLVRDANNQAADADKTLTFHRLLGDSDGDGDVDNLDALRFKVSQGSAPGNSAYKDYFDFDSDGDIDNLDALRFKTNQGKIFTY